MNTSIPSIKTPASKLSSAYVWAGQVSSLPLAPGVYWFLSKDGTVLYVGKAKKLRSRVLSYTRVLPSHNKTYQLVTTAHTLKFQELSSNLEALLTEAELIRTYQPQYNILLKDDKTPLYIIITKEQYPRVLTARKKQLATIYSHLPKSNIFGPFQTNKDARAVLKLSRKIFRYCNAFPKTGKPCFYTHINLCSGACCGGIDNDTYHQQIRFLKLFLRGQRKSLAKKLEIYMRFLAQERLYEKASVIRDQLSSLQNLYQMYRPQLETIMPILQVDIYQDRLLKVKNILQLSGLVSTEYQLNRIEAYDISNNTGTNATASMVVFLAGKPDTSHYKRFKINYASGPNDYEMMREVLTRRMQHQDWPKPDLIVIDGGKGHLKVALSVIGSRVPTVSIAKKPDRLIIARKNQNKQVFSQILLTPGKPVSNLISHIRDESHRFAKKYHRLLQNKQLLS